MAVKPENDFEEAIFYLMSMEQGRKALFSILGECKVDHNVFGFGTENSNETALIAAFRDGKRSIGLAVKSAMMDLDPKNYITGLGEELTRATARAIGKPTKDDDNG